VRGADDILVSDAAAADPAALGKLGIIPGWPGDDVCPPQPMLTQVRAVLDRYRAGDGAYSEHVFPDCGHGPLLEKPDAFRALLREFLAAHPITSAAAATPASSPAARAAGAGAATSQRARGGLFGFLRRRR
jgi:hypothetical protein